MSNLRRELIKLGSEQKHLRPYIRPVLAGLDKGQMDGGPSLKDNYRDAAKEVHNMLRQIFGDRWEVQLANQGSGLSGSGALTWNLYPQDESQVLQKTPTVSVMGLNSAMAMVSMNLKAGGQILYSDDVNVAPGSSARAMARSLQRPAQKAKQRLERWSGGKQAAREDFNPYSVTYDQRINAFRITLGRGLGAGAQFTIALDGKAEARLSGGNDILIDLSKVNW